MARGLVHGIGNEIELARLFVPELTAWDEFVLNREKKADVWRWQCEMGSCVATFHEFDAYDRHVKRCDGVNYINSPKRRSLTPKKGRRSKSRSRSPAKG